MDLFDFYSSWETIDFSWSIIQSDCLRFRSGEIPSEPTKMNDRAKLLTEHGLDALVATLQKAVGRDWEFLADAENFDRLIVQPGWEGMPLAIRVVGHERLEWDRLFERFKSSVFKDRGGRIELASDFPVRLRTAIATTYDGASSSPDETDDSFGQDIAVAIGIDLGTTYSVVAHLDKQGRPWSIPNPAGDILTPSVVYFDDAGPVVGKEALKAGVLEPDRLAECVKRDMGAKVYHKPIRGEHLPPEAISAWILGNLRASAESKLGPVKKAVITVPAFFDEPRRRATLDAGKIAGLDVLDILNEPTAAAIAFGMQMGFLDRSGAPVARKPMRILVFDLGGGTFDVSIVEIQGTDFRVLATDGDVRLGGKDWDDRLARFVATKFQDQTRENPLENPSSAVELMQTVEGAKRTLSERPKATMFVSHLGSRCKIEVSREEFEAISSALVRRTRTTVELVLRQANLGWNEIDRVLLVGGATRMPMIGRMLEEVTGKKPDRSVSPDEAVAHGAAFYAELLLAKESWNTGQSRENPFRPAMVVTNVNSHSLGVVSVSAASGQPVNRVLIPKNSPLPKSVRKTFQTQKQGQRTLKIVVVEGESPDPDACTRVGTLVMRDLPEQLPEGSPIEVEYRYLENGQLEVTAEIVGAQTASTTFVREGRLNDGDVLLWQRSVVQANA